jgi:LAO/AO transport system kinase
MKAGLLEAGEILVLNKADREGFEQTRRHLELLLHLRDGGRVAGGWAARLLPAVATRNEGAGAIVAALDEHRRYLEDSGEFARQCGRRSEQQFIALARAALMADLLCGPGAELLSQVRAGRLDPYTAAEQLSAQLRAGRSPR